jgi:uncharacterized protein YifE (UPF0438 family)
MTEEKKVSYIDLPHIGGYQKMVLDLASGKRTPQNEEEKKILEEIKAIEAKGGMLDLELD